MSARSAEGLLDRMRAVGALVAETASEAESQRRPLDHVVDALKEPGTSVERRFVRYLDNELPRLHQDVHMMAAHTVFDVDLVAEGVRREIVRRLTERADS